MELQIKVPGGLAERLQKAANASGESPGELIVMALAEKLARLEHHQWLARTQQERTSSEENMSAAGDAGKTENPDDEN